MTPPETSAIDLTAEGRAFAPQQVLLASPSDLKEYRRRILTISGSAIAVARYAEEQVRARRRNPVPDSGHRLIQPSAGPTVSGQHFAGIERLEGNTRLLRTVAIEIEHATIRTFRKLPFARGVTGIEMPRITGVARALLNASKYRWNPSGLSSFLHGFQTIEPLSLREIWALPIALKQVLLEEILAQVSGAFGGLPASDAALDAAMECLQQSSLPVWANILEPLVAFEPLLRQDPAGAYAHMDFESRDMYRTTIEKTAERSPVSEMEVTRTALEMARHAAQQPHSDPRVTARRSHIGYYLVDDGFRALRIRCGYRPSLRNRARFWMQENPDDFYIGGIQAIALLAMAAVILPLVALYNPIGSLLLAILFVLIPVSQFAVELVNHVVNAVLKPQILPKLDFSNGVPDDCKTLVTIPTLLLNESQVHELVEELEVRSLANQDPNIHYALLTDLPDSPEKPREGDTHPLVILAGRLIDDLNRRYAESNAGGYLMLHRHRVFNPRQGVWMGWERKRGKLLDLNRLIMGGLDCFPFKAGDRSVLQGIRYILTLDSDTKLPRDAVHRMVGAMAHPLNQAILDPVHRIVTQGYALLQPRVGITVRSVARSRLASIYSGETGFDIYTRAISDVYQDLYGHGTFTGKGLYEVRVLHSVLDRRFPQNFLLSHDLIEGAYGRVGLVTDVEVMDDYPSHYSAQNRRKHRWVRGDWQILRWLRNRVPNEAGQLVQNPISTISRWKIFDNLRRSVVEPATLILLVMGWLWLPGTPRYWTTATLLIVFVPVLVQFAFSGVRALTAEQKGHFRKSIEDSLGLLLSTALNFIFLAHQTLLMIDAIVRSLVRSFVTGQYLLEWETAAQAETGNKKTPVETTMSLTPILSLLLGVLIWWIRPQALPWSVPILVLWALTKPLTLWLNHPRNGLEFHLSSRERRWLRKIAWRTWQYFVHFSAAENLGLVPDNVQQEMDGIGDREALRLSPTNAGLQLNARQAAVLLGYLTLPEYATQTFANLETLDRIPKWKGHLLNWYSVPALDAISPRIVSTVDSGNLLASLCSLRMGTLDLERTPLLPPLKQGLLDALEDEATLPSFKAAVQTALDPEDLKAGTWLTRLFALDTSSFEESSSPDNRTPAGVRLRAILDLVTEYLPWLQPKYEDLRKRAELDTTRPLDFWTLQSARTICLQTRTALMARIQHDPERNTPLAHELVAELTSAEACLTRLWTDLRHIADMSNRMFQATDFRVLLNPSRRLLAIGYDTERDQPLDPCYDLLASEARTAAFLAIAKGDIPQETWFKAGRRITLVDGHPTLMSWSGTMFEYMMPTLWTQTWPDTLLGQSMPAVVRAQREFVAGKRIPWGVSEAGHSERDVDGNYQYRAFGIPTLALNPPGEDALVIAPYASILALETDPEHALPNLRKMEKLGWLGEFGFYESADYSSNRQPLDKSKYVLVRSWMAHHQGMSLLALANFLCGRPFQRWFHSDPRVRATELLLQEKPVEVNPPREDSHAEEFTFQPVVPKGATGG